jgi:hypothetical protein
MFFSIKTKISLQNLSSSDSIFFLYSVKCLRFLLPFVYSLCSIDDRARHAVLLDPTEFLYATDNKFLSSSFNS